MRYQFTPAVERALQLAASWTLRTDGEAELDAPQLLFALASEVECRAAVILRALAIDPAAIVEHWPQLRAVETSPSVAPTALFTAAVGESLAQVIGRLHDHPRPLSLATEHILLGLALAEHDVARWLVERGLDIIALEAEIHRRAGQQFIDQPLEMPAESPLLPVRATADIAAQPTDSERLAVYRLLDAAANRAREGLRVIEDYVRFALDDGLLTREWKQLRHDLTEVLKQFAMPERLAARDTLADVGTRISTASEQSRPDIAAVVAANVARLQESLRSLEEYAKTLAPAAAATLEQLRYRSYTLHRALDVTQRRSREWDTCRLYVLLDGRESLAAFTELAQQLIAAGVDVLQLRDKRLDDRQLLERGRRLRELTRDTATRFIMNDRADLAVLADADGLHVGQEELTVKDARTIVGPRRLVGVSTHSLEQVRQAVLDGADYIGVGPTFPSSTKSFEQFPGVELLRAAAAETRLPAFAIGGITLARLDEVLATGLRRVAVSGAIVSAADPVAAVREFRAKLI